MRPDRVVIGGKDAHALAITKESAVHCIEIAWPLPTSSRLR